MIVAYNLLRQLRGVEAHLADLPFVIPASLNALTFLTTPKASLEHIVSTVISASTTLAKIMDVRCPVVEFSLRISSFVDPLTAMISCPFVPENEPTAAKEILVGGESVRLSKCILTGCRGAISEGVPERFGG